MGNRIDTKILLGSERFKSSINGDLSLNVPLDNTQKEMDEYDRSIVLSLADIFDDERQKSSIFRFTVNLDLLFFNSYYGVSNYPSFRNQLFYLDPEKSFENDIWSGYPQYKEFDFIRTDNNVSGYTKNQNDHIKFVNEESAFYNWNFYLSYPYSNDSNKRMLYNVTSGNSFSWVASEGIPYQIINPYFDRGQNLISLKCPVNHNFQVGQYVEITYLNKKYIEQVISLGNNGFNSDSFILNINSVKLSTILPNGGMGTLKRIVDINSKDESKSIYYVRKNRILTKFDDAILTKAGFEQNGFGVKNQFQYSQVTPDGLSRVAQRHGNQSYNLTFKRDIDILPLRDNLNRPITEIYVTILNRGYFGWFNKPIANNIGVREGFEFNLTNFISPYWGNSNNTINLSNIQTASYSSNGRTFYYNRNLTIGDTLNNDFCEFNTYDQQEYVLSNTYHKIYFNEDHFILNGINTQNKPGYYYKPHHKIQLRVFSDYTEELPIENIDGAPDYSDFLQSKNSLIWRDIYTYGYKDEKGLGVDYPFINGTHYPFSKIIFRIKPEGNINQDINTIGEPTIDECE